MARPPEKRGARGRSGLKVRVRTARGRKLSSTRWLQRQLNDPYVEEARRQGYRSRAAFKLLELDEKFQLLKGARRVVDLGAAPGGWTQVLVERFTRSGQKDNKIVGIDILPMDPISGADLIEMDFLAPQAPAELKALLGGPADIVLSDMAAPTTGHKQTDHIRTMGLCEAALDFAMDVLEPGGTFVAKVLRGGTDDDLLRRMKLHFSTVRHAKPPASRPESVEWYVIASGFTGKSQALNDQSAP
ncbi:ribosomal RNA large subunit methyltransferase E [Iodidimonas muriae]|uniref:Ribosomal RNA large subunit methyltransferase E n=1 Tax=Iodidimonas muriae TaxID=261467 RepID=A0ABQ2LE63_9PROT|nr:RlmE family RNA methyltransferase [Iodidimonas muriae]GER07075.1 ribosomal RNA large subunit methyltransferase E [Kordiimonadales bacterium JCM 17843]GGO13104.1 ribosomal RNA large subunit methyltransferase E [Iodidimonas muriae]